MGKDLISSIVGDLLLICTLLSVIFASFHECRAYVPPPVKVEPLYPTGLRMSIPGKIFA